MFPVTLSFASLAALALVGLSWNVIRHRMRAKVGLGDGGDKLLMGAQRAQGNFAEYVPFILILSGLIEAQGGNLTLLCVLLTAAAAGRAMHAVSMLHFEPKTDGRNFKFRQYGMLVTFGVLCLLALWGLALSVM